MEDFEDDFLLHGHPRYNGGLAIISEVHYLEEDQIAADGGSYNQQPSLLL